MNLEKAALLLFNLQIDYCPGGAMEVNGADQLIPKANQLMPLFAKVIAVNDWHPANHISFAGNHPWRHIGQILTIDGRQQLLKPIHCVQHTFGAHFYPGLEVSAIDLTLCQGSEPNQEDGSAFATPIGRHKATLAEWLAQAAIEHLFLMGINSEEKMLQTTKDALQNGLQLWGFSDASLYLHSDTSKNKKWQEELTKAGLNWVSMKRFYF